MTVSLLDGAVGLGYRIAIRLMAIPHFPDESP